MTNLKFPQIDNIPISIKDKVMDYVIFDMKQRGSLVKKAKISKIFVPISIMLLLFVGVFSLVYTSLDSNKDNTNGEIVRLEKKINEIETILNELDNI